jgi:dihydroneopterin aldolase
MQSSETKVVVEGLLVEAYVGLHDPEMETLQPIQIDLCCELIKPEVPHDDIRETFDYFPVIEEIRILAKEKKRRLIETFGEEIATLCFAYEGVGKVTVSVRKPRKFPQVEAVGVTRTFVL